MSDGPVVFGGFTFGQAAEGGNHEDHEDDAPLPSPKANTALKRRQTVSAEVYDASKEQAFRPEKYPKSPADEEALTQLLESHYLFKHLDDRELANLVELFEPMSYEAGQELSEEAANAHTSHFHVIMDGECEVKAGDQVLRTLGSGSTCGETEMMYSQPATEHVIAKTAVRSFCIDRETYQRTLHSTFAEKRALYCEFLKNVKFLEGLSKKEMVQLADCLEAIKFKQGETMIPCHAPPDAIYIIMEGVVKVVGRDENNNNIDVCEFTRGAIVGELEFLNDHNNVADVIAKSPEVRAARLEKKHFELCMGPVKDLLKSSRKADPVYDYYRKKRANAGEEPTDPEGGIMIDVYPNRLPYTYAGQVKSLMKEGEAKVTLTALGRAVETSVATANRLKEAKLVAVKKVSTFMSEKGLPGIRIVLEKASDFEALLKEADSQDASTKETEASA